MKKIWAYVAMFFVGLSAGLLVAVRVAGDTYAAYIKRIRQKGKDNSEQEVVFKPIFEGLESTKGRYQRKQERLEKRMKKLSEKESR